MAKRKRMGSDGAGARCAYCFRVLRSTRDRGSAGATRDHVQPKSLGGTHRVWCCRACNNLKSNMTPAAWVAFMKANPNWWDLWLDRQRAATRLAAFQAGIRQ